MASLNTFRLEVAKTKLVKISNKAEIKELAASNWISTTCRDIQTAIIKTCAYNNRFALKCAFGEPYNDLSALPSKHPRNPTKDMEEQKSIKNFWEHGW